MKKSPKKSARNSEKRTKKASATRKTLKSGDLPVTQKHLQEVRSELKSDTASLRLEMKAGFKAMDARFEQIDSRFELVDSRFEQVDARFETMMSELYKMRSIIEAQDSKFHHNNALFEEMLTQNKYILDSLSINNDRLDRLEKLVTSLIA